MIAAPAAWPPLAEIGLKGAVGLLTYGAIKKPLHWAADKLFDLDKETTHDRIASLKKDHEAHKPITREQVLSVFVKANPQIDQMIAADFGKHYDQLDLAHKQKAAEALAKLLPLDQLANDINHDKINVSELAFAVEGRISGAHHQEHASAKKEGLLAGMLSSVNKAFAKKEAPHAPEAAAPAAAPVRQAAEYDNPAPERSFVEQHKLQKKEPAMGYVKRLNLEPRGPIELG